MGRYPRRADGRSGSPRDPAAWHQPRSAQQRADDSGILAQVRREIDEKLSMAQGASATMIVAGLVRPEMKVEIEVTAFKG